MSEPAPFAALGWFLPANVSLCSSVSLQCGIHGFFNYEQPLFVTTVVCNGPEDGRSACRIEPGCQSYAWSEAQQICNLYNAGASEANSRDPNQPACQIWDVAC